MGPTLHGLFGRKAGTAPGYKCSAALQRSGIVWDDATLDKYLTNPRGLVPGGKMSLPRIADGAKRAALIAYLKAATR